MFLNKRREPWHALARTAQGVDIDLEADARALKHGSTAAPRRREAVCVGIEDAISAERMSVLRRPAELRRGVLDRRQSCRNVGIALAVVLERRDVDQPGVARRRRIFGSRHGDLEHHLRELADRIEIGRITDVVDLASAMPPGLSMIRVRQSTASSMKVNARVWLPPSTSLIGSPRTMCPRNCVSTRSCLPLDRPCCRGPGPTQLNGRNSVNAIPVPRRPR